MLEVFWIVWLISWVAASFWSTGAQKCAATLETWTYRAAMIVGGVLLVRFDGPVGQKPIWQISSGGVYALGAVMLTGADPSGRASIWDRCGQA